jgi:hypothetical protein
VEKIRKLKYIKQELKKFGMCKYFSDAVILNALLADVLSKAADNT